MFDYYEPLASIEEVCEALHIGRNSVYKLLNSGDLKGWRIGKCWKIPKRAVKDYICQKTQLSAAIW